MYIFAGLPCNKSADNDCLLFPHVVLRFSLPSQGLTNKNVSVWAALPTAACQMSIRVLVHADVNGTYVVM